MQRVKHSFRSQGVGLIAFVLAACVFGGCADNRGIITSLEDITTEYDDEGGSQRRLVAINGILPYINAGSGIFDHKKDRAPSTAIGITDGKSYRFVREVPYCGKFEELVEIRDKILGVQRKASSYVVARVRLTALLASQQPGADISAAIEAAEKDVRAKQTDYDDAYEKAVGLIKKPGVMVFRWKTSNQAAAGTTIGGVFRGGAHQSQAYSGFVVVGGLRVITLVAGEDLCEIPSKYDHRMITTFAMQAKHILYSTQADLSRSLEAHLTASPSQLSNLSDTLLAADKIEAKIILAQAQSLGNMANISGMIFSTEKLPMARLGGDGQRDGENDLLSPGFSNGETAGAQNGETSDGSNEDSKRQPFYVVNMKIGDLKKVIRGR